jgi:hypothetical protein
MTSNKEIDLFLSQYSTPVFEHAQSLRKLLTGLLPGVIEQLDAPAKMIGYSYGPKYEDLVCVLIPSKKGLKLGFNKGTELNDPEGWLKGQGKISRYVEIVSPEQIQSKTLHALVQNALELYRIRSKSENRT